MIVRGISETNYTAALVMHYELCIMMVVMMGHYMLVMMMATGDATIGDKVHEGCSSDALVRSSCVSFQCSFWPSHLIAHINSDVYMQFV